MKLQDIADSETDRNQEQNNTYSTHQKMDNIDKGTHGMQKHLDNLNPHKAAGPD